MKLKPSEIFYSQDSINGYFDSKSNHRHIKIGQTLDDICEGRCSIDDIPTISVVVKDGRWVTADNRRLWVFRQLERLGKCSDIPVKQTGYINPNKFTSFNGGVSVEVRGYPGGQWHKKQAPKPKTITPVQKKIPAHVYKPPTYPSMETPAYYYQPRPVTHIQPTPEVRNSNYPTFDQIDRPDRSVSYSIPSASSHSRSKYITPVRSADNESTNGCCCVM